MDAPIKSSNRRAWASLVLGALSVAALPAAIAVAQYLEQIDLLHAAAGIPVAALAGLLAILLGRRARRIAWITLGRAGGARVAFAGRLLGGLGLYLATTAALAFGFYGLLQLFAS